MIRFRGQVYQPLPTGALYWAAGEALLVADLHFEKMSAFAATGQLLPPYDTRMTLARLERDLTLTGAKRVIALGDSFHRDFGVTTLLPADRERLLALTRRAEWTWLAGNHDPSPHALGGVCRAEVALGGCLLSHEPRQGARGLIAGHLHPAARVAMNGQSARRACFVWDENLMILPAYGAATGSLNILSPAFAGLFSRASLQVAMLGRDRVYSVSVRRLVAG